MLGAPVVGAQEDPALELSDTSGAVGEAIDANGSGWMPELGEVRIFLNPSSTFSEAPLETFTVEEDGTISGTFQVPDVPPDVYELVACQDCGDVDGYPRRSFEFTVAPVSDAIPTESPTGTEAPPTEEPTSAPPTGDERTVESAPRDEASGSQEGGRFEPWMAAAIALVLAAIGLGLAARWVRKRRVRRLGERVSALLDMGEAETRVTVQPNGAPGHSVELLPRGDPGTQRLEEVTR